MYGRVKCGCSWERDFTRSKEKKKANGSCGTVLSGLVGNLSQYECSFSKIAGVTASLVRYVLSLL